MITDYISLDCLALTLSLPRAYLKRLVDAGKLPYINAGNGRKRFQEKVVRDALSRIEKQQIKPASQLQQTLGGDV